MQLQQKKEFERLANITPNLTDYGKKGLKPNGETKPNFHQLKDGRVVKKDQVLLTQAKENIDGNVLEAKATANPQLKNFGKFGLKNDGTPKNGYYQTKDGKVISIKQLNVIDAETVQP